MAKRGTPKPVAALDPVDEIDVVGTGEETEQSVPPTGEPNAGTPPAPEATPAGIRVAEKEIQVPAQQPSPEPPPLKLDESLPAHYSIEAAPFEHLVAAISLGRRVTVYEAVSRIGAMFGMAKFQDAADLCVKLRKNYQERGK